MNCALCSKAIQSRERALAWKQNSLAAKEADPVILEVRHLCLACMALAARHEATRIRSRLRSDTMRIERNGWPYLDISPSSEDGLVGQIIYHDSAARAGEEQKRITFGAEEAQTLGRALLRLAHGQDAAALLREGIGLLGDAYRFFTDHGELEGDIENLNDMADRIEGKA